MKCLSSQVKGSLVVEVYLSCERNCVTKRYLAVTCGATLQQYHYEPLMLHVMTRNRKTLESDDGADCRLQIDLTMTTPYTEDYNIKYATFPLVQSMLQNEVTRTNSLKEQGKNQINYPLSSDGWASSLFIIRGRALDWMVLPWLLVVGHAVLYTMLQELLFNTDASKRQTDTWEIFFR